MTLTRSLLALMLVPTAVAAQERDLSTDRPDRTESPFTVPRGRWQLEADLLSYTRDRDGVTRATALSVTAVNLKYGIGRHADLQFVLEPIVHETVRGPGEHSGATSVGTASARLKLNLAGNDGGRVAIGLLPYVNLVPADGRRLVEGGVILPVAVALAPGWNLGTMAEVGLVAGDASGRRALLVHSVTIGRALGERTGLYLELYQGWVPSLRQAGWERTFDAGVTWALTPLVQLDAGANFGLSAAAPGVNPFTGFSIRF